VLNSLGTLEVSPLEDPTAKARWILLQKETALRGRVGGNCEGKA